MRTKALKISWLLATSRWLTFGLLLLATRPAGGQAGALDTSYQPNPSYVVAAIAIQPDGKAVIGGGFGTVNGLERRYLARLNTDGTVDTGFVPATVDGSEVRALALQPDGKVLLGGQFSRLGETAAFRVARLQTNGDVDTTFNCTLTSAWWIYTLALQSDGKVLVASDDGLDRLMPDGSRDTNFQRLSAFQWITNAGGMTTAYNSIRSVAELGDGKTLLGGNLQAIEGLALGAGVLRLNPDGTWDQGFQYFTNGGISVLLVQPDGRIVVGRNGLLARLHADGTMDDTFATQAIAGDVMALARQPDGKILVGGYFERAAGLLRAGVARFNSDGTLDRDFDAGAVDGFTVSSVALQADKEILIAGYFTSVNGQNRPYVARLQNDNPSYPGRFEFLSISNAVVEAAGRLVIPVARYAGSAGTASVVVATDWGSAYPGEDYLSLTQMLVFLPGQTSNYFTIPILDDSQVEGSYGWETIGMQLSAPTGGATLGSEKRATGYILEDDTAIGFASSGNAAYESAGQAVITLVRLGVTSSAVSVDCRTIDGTAVAPGDYTAQSGTVTFAPGETNQTILVPLDDDALVEGEETFNVGLSAPTGGASLATSNVTVYITDDVSFMAFDANPTVAETDGPATLAVRRWGRTNNTVSVHYATSNLTALTGTDYVATSGTLTLRPGEVEGTFTVPIIDDSGMEDLEKFQVMLSEPVGTLVLPYWQTSTVSLISDDGAGYPDTRFKPAVPGGRVNQIVLCPGGGIIVRGDSVLTNGTWQPTLLRYNPDGSVDPAFHPGLADDLYSIAASPDGKVYVCTGYGIGTSVRRVLADGQPDGTFDPFFVDYTVSPPSLPSRGMVVQADGKLLVSAYPAPYYGYESVTNCLNRLNEDGTYDLTFGPVCQLGDEKLASPPSALALQPDGRIVIAATLSATNGVSRNRLVCLTDDGHFDVTFSPTPEVTGSIRGIRPLTNGKLLIYGSFTAINGVPRLGMAVIASDGSLDPAFVPAFQAYDYFNNSVLAATVQGDGKVVFCGDVRLPGGIGLPLGRLNSNGSMDSSFRSVSFFSAYLWDLALQGDGKVLLGGSSGPFFGAGLERLNNDPQVAAGALEFSAGSQVVSETNRSVTVAVRRGGGTNGLVRLRYATVSGTATAASDFVPQAGIIEFPAGDASEKQITICLLDDALAEGDESFAINLGSPVGGAVWGEHATTTITIRDNDTTLQFLNARFLVRENAGGALITVQRLGDTTGVVSVDYSTSDVIAQAGLDYLAQSGTLTFTEGETNRMIVVTISDDPLGESDETVQLTLSHPTSGAMLGTNATAELVIVDNDRPGTLDPSFNPGLGVCDDYGTGAVCAVAVQNDGRILVGGGFSRFNGVACRGIVRLHSNGSLDPSFTVSLPGSMPSWIVTRIAVQPDGSVLLVAGFEWSNFLVRLNALGVWDRSFGFIAPDRGWIEALLLQPDGKILIGGVFNTVKGVGRTNVARLYPDGSLDNSFAPNLTNESGYAEVTAMAIDGDGKIVLGGTFDHVDAVCRRGLARFDAAGGLDAAFDPGDGLANASGERYGVYPDAIVIRSNSKILVGGSFAQYNRSLRTNLAQLNADGSLDTNFSAVVTSDLSGNATSVSVLALQADHRILVGGHFTAVNGFPRKNLARLTLDGSLDLGFQCGEDKWKPDYYSAADEVHALAVQLDGQIIVGGQFSEIDGQPRCGVARLNGVQLKLGDVTRDADGRWRIRFSGTAGAGYSVLASSNLIYWETIGTAFETALGSFEFSDTASANQSSRYYRLRAP